jgi:hypothetical protein
MPPTDLTSSLSFSRRAEVRRNLRVMALLELLLVLTLVAWGATSGAPARAQDGLEVGVDANPSGNSATSLGSIESCTSVRIGETFSVDIFVANVKALLGWEAYFVYDTAVVNVVDRDVRMFQASSPGSSVFDASEGLPDDDGRYRLGAADIAEPPSPDSGSGVLARLTLRSVGAGVTPASISPIDTNGDGTPDLGPSLVDVSGNPIGDADGDRLLDNPAVNAWIAVDTACPTGAPAGPTTPPLTTTPQAVAAEGPNGGGAGILGSEGEGLWPWACVAGGLAALALAGLAAGHAPGRRPRS